MDVWKLAEATTLIALTFWRRRYEDKKCIDAVHQRCPLLCKALGTNAHQTFAIDTLLAQYFGPVQKFESAVFWRVILPNPWAFAGHEQAKLEKTVNQLRSELFAWYQSSGVDFKHRVNDFTVKMMGEKRLDGNQVHVGCALKLKAAESGAMLPFAMHVLKKYGATVPFYAELEQAV